MKLFKNTKAFLAAALLVAGLCLTTSCSSPASDKTDDGGSGSGGLNNYSSSGSIDDGNAIAYYLCESLCSSSKESVKLCFYGDNTFKLRQTSLDDDDYGQRYDYMLGTYEGDPTKDGSIIINFTKIREFEFIYTGDPSDLDNIDSLEDFSKLDQSKISGGYRYKDISKDFEPDIDVKIKDGQFTLSNLNYSGNLNGFYHSSLSFTKTDAKDRGPYQYTGVSRRANDPRRTEWTIPEGYTSIADGGFSSSDNKLKLLKKITLPSTIKKIGDRAFYNLIGLEEINIPEACTEIGSSAFYNCISLKSLTLPLSLERISDNTFTKARLEDGEVEKTNILELKIANGASEIPDEFFMSSYSYNTPLIKTVIIPSTVKKIGKKAFYSFKTSEAIQIPEGVEEICENAFYSSANQTVEQYTIPSTVKKIGESAFYNWKIKKLVLSEGVEEIGRDAFYYYSYSSSDTAVDTEVVLPSSIKKLESNAFNYDKLKKITSNSSLYDLSKLFDNEKLRYSSVQIFCGDVNVSPYFQGYVISDLLYQWDEEDKNDGILLTLKSDKTYIMQDGDEKETGLWFAERKEDSSDEGKITFCPYVGKLSSYEFSYDSQKLTLTDFANLKKVDYFSVIEKKEITSEKWCEKAVPDESGEYVYYQYYLNKTPKNYMQYLDNSVYYKYYESSESLSDYTYENRYYKSCKEKIEDVLNNSYYNVFGIRDTYDEDNNSVSMFYLYSDPLQDDKE